ncbi:MAG: DUF1566 domain-containing protein [Polyangia bacterium]
MPVAFLMVLVSCRTVEPSRVESDTEVDSDTYVTQMEPCEGGYLDPATGLCWRPPPTTFPHEYQQFEGMNWYDASGTIHEQANKYGLMDFCGDAMWGGYQDWRLPDIDELLSILRGCVCGKSTGDFDPTSCGLEDPGCLETPCAEGEQCDRCLEKMGPGVSGCYCDPALSYETCDDFWSSSLDESGKVWTVDFETGSIEPKEKMKSDVNIFCVRRIP